MPLAQVSIFQRTKATNQPAARITLVSCRPDGSFFTLINATRLYAVPTAIHQPGRQGRTSRRTSGNDNNWQNARGRAGPVTHVKSLNRIIQVERATSGHGRITVMRRTNGEMLGAQWATFRAEVRLLTLLSPTIVYCSYKNGLREKQSQVKEKKNNFN